jgi:hypothetical protein
MENEILKLYERGSEVLYAKLILDALSKIKSLPESREEYPDLLLLKMAEAYLGIYRRDQQKKMLEISKVFRRAGHKVHRILVKKKKIKKNRKFLNIV